MQAPNGSKNGHRTTKRLLTVSTLGAIIGGIASHQAPPLAAHRRNWILTHDGS